MKLVTRNLLYTLKSSTPPTPPVPEGHQLEYLQNGDNTSDTKQRNWSINTGIVWRDVFLNATSLGLTLPGLETEIVYSYTYGTPEGGLIAGSHPLDSQDEGDMGGFWRIFGHDDSNFCFDCPSEDDRNQVSIGSLTTGAVYYERLRYGYVEGSTLRSSMMVRYNNSTSVLGSNTITPDYSWKDAEISHNLYLWSDITNPEGDSACRGGVRIYSFKVYYLEGETRHTKIYEGVPWMDSNNVPCIKDLVSGQLQYNCAPSPQPFLYGELS